MSPSPFALFALLWAGTLFGASATALGRAFVTRGADRAKDPDEDAGAHAPSTLEILLVRPVSGTDTWLDDALSSMPRGLVRERLRIRIAVADPDDDAYPIAVRAVARLVEQGFAAALCLTAASGQNRKAAQLAAVLRQEPAPLDPTRAIVIVADADVDLAASPLGALARAFDDGQLGAIWSPPVERAPALTLADRASQALLGGSLHAFPLLAHLDRGGLVGKLCALRRSSLDAVGGFEALVPWLGEDMRLAEALRAAEVPFRSTKGPAVSVANGRTTGAVLARYARWLQVIRAQRSVLLLGYPTLFFGTWPAALCCLGAAWHVQSPLLAVAAAVLVSMRLVVASVAARFAGRASTWATPLVDAVLADALLLAAFGLALTQRQVAWKTNRFTFDRRGRLREAEEAPRAIA